MRVRQPGRGRVTQPYRRLFDNSLPVQVGRFGAVGVAATATHYLVATLVLTAVGAYAANLAGYLAAVGLSYQGHRRWTFRVSSDGMGNRWPFARFVVVSLAALGLSEAVLHLGLSVPGLPRSVALLFAVLTVPPVTFLATRFWVFRGALPPTDQETAQNDTTDPFR